MHFSGQVSLAAMDAYADSVANTNLALRGLSRKPKAASVVCSRVVCCASSFLTPRQHNHLIPSETLPQTPALPRTMHCEASFHGPPLLSILHP